MASSQITLKLTPSEYRTLKHELENSLRDVCRQYEVAKEGNWHHNSDGKALARRQLELTELIQNI